MSLRFLSSGAFTPRTTPTALFANALRCTAAFAFLCCLSVPARAQLINGGFELPAITPGIDDFEFISDSAMVGWKTIPENTIFEVWSDNFLEVTSYEGSQHLELNGDGPLIIFQDILGIAPGTDLGFEFAHRGRLGVDTVALSITDLGLDNLLGGGDDTELFRREYSTGDTRWAFYSSIYEPHARALGNTTRITFTPIATAGDEATVGNFLDAVRFGGDVGIRAVAPEPSPLALLGSGLGIAGLAVRLRRAR